jgi:multidrug efflux system membrane fusion protein
VTIGHEDAQVSIVSDGLKPDETVVVDGASRLTDHSKVTVAQPSAAAGAQAGPDQPAPPGAARRRARSTSSQ